MIQLRNRGFTVYQFSVKAIGNNYSTRKATAGSTEN